MKKRIGNLEFCPASYLLPKEQWPKHPAWHIDYWYPNAYYGHEANYIKQNEDWYCYPDYPQCRIHKDCFKNPQSCMAIAAFDYNEDENIYEFRFVGERPLRITPEEKEAFWELVEYGFKQLNKEEE